MQEETERQILEVLREIREGQRDALARMDQHRALVEEQLKLSRGTVEESVGLQRLAVKRQRSLTYLAMPAIIVCILAIVYLIVRHF
jgi:hypothetical protein